MFGINPNYTYNANVKTYLRSYNVAYRLGNVRRLYGLSKDRPIDYAKRQRTRVQYDRKEA